MKKTFIAVGVASLLGLTSVAQAAEFDWSGTIRAGYTSRDTGGSADAVNNLGDSAGSRINLNASTDLGNGQSAGTEISTVLGEDVGGRRNNIWFSGGWGKLTLGKHGGTYRSAANWDQTSYLGGGFRTEAGSAGGDTAIVYASNLGGPFSFDIEVASIRPVTAVTGSYLVTQAESEVPVVVYGATAPKVGGTRTFSGGGTDTIGGVTETRKHVTGVDGKTIGRWAVTAHYDFGAVTANLGYNALTTDPAGYENNTAFSVNGAAGGFDYYLAYEISKHGGTGDKNKDAKTVGLFLSYDAGDNRFYVNYVDASIDNEANDPNQTVLGYRYDLGAGVDFTAEHSTVKKDATAKSLNLTLRYGF